MLNLPQLSGFICTGLLIWSGANLALLDNQGHRTPDPTLPGDEDPVANYHVDVEEIQQFETYYLNDLNPFIPWNKREPERRWLKQRRERKDNTPPAEVPKQFKPTPPPEKPVVLPKLELPAFAGTDDNVPKVIGSVATEKEFLLFVQLGKEERPLRAGDKIGGWELLGLQNNMASFKDPDGEMLQVPVGNADADANSITDAGSAPGAASGTAQNPLLNSAGLNAKDVLQMLKDPKNKKRVEEMMKDPEMQQMLRNPTIRQYLRQNGLGHLLD